MTTLINIFGTIGIIFFIGALAYVVWDTMPYNKQEKIKNFFRK